MVGQLNRQLAHSEPWLCIERIDDDDRYQLDPGRPADPRIPHGGDSVTAPIGPIQARRRGRPGNRPPMRTYPGTAWMMAGACRDTDPETFFPIGSVGPEALRINDAKATCQRCPVVKTCLSWAIETGQEYGVWGGQSEDERRLTRFHDGAVA